MTTMSSDVRLRIFCIFITGSVLAAIAHSADQTAFWPQYHGPNRDNISAEKDLLDAWPEGGPDLAWTVDGLGEGYSSVSVANGRIYTAGNVDGNTLITALELDGTKLWQVKNGKAWKKSYPGTRSTPTIDGEFLYHESPHGDVTCLNATTGEKIWTVNLLEKYNAENIQWALSESLLIDGDHVICSPGGPEVSMLALDKRTGAVVWTTPSTDDLSGYTSAVLFEQGGLRIITTLTSEKIIGVNADTGALLWAIPHGSPRPQSAANPIYHDGHLLIVTLNWGSELWKVNVDGDKASLESAWHNQDFANHHGGVLMTNETIYGWNTSRKGGKWDALDWASGKLKDSGTDIERGAVTYADGKLYLLGAKKGQVGLMQTTESGFEFKSSFNIPKGGKGPSWAHPVIAGGHLYISHGVFLYKYDVSGS